MGVCAKFMDVTEYILVRVVLDSVVGDSDLGALPLRNAVLLAAGYDAALETSFCVCAQR